MMASNFDTRREREQAGARARYQLRTQAAREAKQEARLKVLAERHLHKQAERGISPLHEAITLFIGVEPW